MKSARTTYIFIWLLCIIGSWSVIPYNTYLGIFPVSISLWKIAFYGTFQAALLFGLACWISLKVQRKTDLKPFPPLHRQTFVQQVAIPALIYGVLLGFTIFISDTIIFGNSLLSGVHPPLWAGALASIYGGINEEVLFRLFFFTLIYFFVGKIFKIHQANRSIILWSVNIFVALLFGLGHLPAALKIAQPSFFEIFRILSLNGIAALVFGWLYWSRGLWTAICAHFVTDLMIHVFLI